MDEIITIRVDGNSEIGFGHLMRMKALARELGKLGAEVIFLSRNPENIEGYRVMQLKRRTGAEEDLRVEEMLMDLQAGMFIIDSYEYTRKRLDRLGQLPLLSVYVDDLNRHPFNTDFVINGNLYAQGLPYRGRARFLLGSKYLLMREEFARVPLRLPNPGVEHVLITFGAADMENITPGFLHILRSYEHFEDLYWHVVIGPVFCNLAEIEAVARVCPNVVLHYNPAIKNLMDFCDMSISAAGSTTYELAACGVPAMLVVAADNQLRLAREAEQQGIAFNLGWHHELEAARLYSALDSLINNQMLREKMAVCGQELIDGRGAQRVAAILMDEMRKNR
ncbi:UDP-2,4-diacetamido-2,4,6-trideoxy-beta-L-altropyranose hydrolase [Syntrophomonas wolfei]|jgi:UDP-2,4-diacetamido-2,4,6-trideoxy-beta-L-altropyranose hydrolase|nr:UDP-2,4-diacetamido-2,4,6-trideoxy-beta-L-altropyranose hydrolase [Syntrophomonas wolfei]